MMDEQWKNTEVMLVVVAGKKQKAIPTTKHYPPLNSLSLLWFMHPRPKRVVHSDSMMPHRRTFSRKCRSIRLAPLAGGEER